MSHPKKAAFPNLPRAWKGSNPPPGFAQSGDRRVNICFVIVRKRGKYALRERGRERVVLQRKISREEE